jgi:hypothetical protein
MRYMMVMIPNLPEQTEDWAPDAEAAAAMGRYNEELTKAGVLLALDGLHPISEGARVAFGADAKPTVTDGPFTEAKEVIGGYWLIQARSKEEAIEWARRIPGAPGNIVEVRRVYEMSDHAPDVQEAARLSATPPEQTVAS